MTGMNGWRRGGAEDWRCDVCGEAKARELTSGARIPRLCRCGRKARARLEGCWRGASGGKEGAAADGTRRGERPHPPARDRAVTRAGEGSNNALTGGEERYDRQELSAEGVAD